MADLLSVQALTVVFRTRPPTYAVDNVTFSLPETPRVVSLVGESGSGKTTISRAILRLLRPSSGHVYYMGQDIWSSSRAWQWQFRREVQAVFQNPYSVYNPVYKVERVFNLAIRKFGLASTASQARARIGESLRAVDLHPAEVLGRYPHQLSGGMRQRVMLARLHLLRPRLVVADEPVSMIDAGMRASFLNILLDFRDHYGISTLFITHDLSTAEYLGDDIIVLYQGRIAERGPIRSVLRTPLHPYTQLLMSSVPVPDPTCRWADELPAAVDTGTAATTGRDRCLYAPRCAFATPECWSKAPELRPVQVMPRDSEHEVACWHVASIAATIAGAQGQK